MLHALAGSTVEINGTSGWVRIAEPEGLGFLGGQWNLIDLTDKSDAVESRFMKGNRSPAQMQMAFGVVLDDPGQIELWRAYYSENDWEFAITFPDGVTKRIWRALVIGLGEAFDAANEVIRLQATLQINSDVVR